MLVDLAGMLNATAMLARDTDTADLGVVTAPKEDVRKFPVRDFFGARFAPSVSVAQLFGLFVTVKKER